MSRLGLYAIPLGLASMCSLLTGACTATGDRALTVGAAASMRVVMPGILAEFSRKSGLKVMASYAASGTIARQVERGAPLDLVVMASPAVLDELEHGGFLVPASRRSLATNSIVLVGRTGTPPVLFSALGHPGPRFRIAVGDPRNVPVGVYARQLLEDLGHWQGLAGHLVLGRDVAGVLAYARRGEVDAGIVYDTDTVGVPGLRVFDRAQGIRAPEPEVVAALIVNSEQMAGRAAALLDFLVSDNARHALSRAGFGPPRPVS